MMDGCVECAFNRYTRKLGGLDGVVIPEDVNIFFRIGFHTLIPANKFFVCRGNQIGLNPGFDVT